MKMLKKMAMRAVALLLLALTIAAPACAEYVGSVPDDGVYITQTRRHTCTLVAATMMLRNYAYLNDNIYEHVTESAVRRSAWNSRGLSWDFSLGMVNVLCSKNIQSASDKKAYLIDCLSTHREGVVIYDANAPHAIWLFGYDEATDTFYCADTTTDVAGRAIRLEESILKGRTQEEKIASLDRVWYVANGGAI